MAPGNTIQPAKNNGTVNSPPADRAIDRLKSQLELSASLENGNGVSGQEITAAVVERMLTADSLDAAMEAQDASLPSGKALADVEMTVTGITVVTSDSKYTEHSLGYYLIVDAARLDNGKELRFAVGAPNVVTLLFRADNEGMLPLECVIRARETANGELLSLRRIPKRAAAVKAGE